MISERLHLRFVLSYQLLDVVAALTRPAGADGRQRVATYLVERAPEPDQGVATHLARVLESVPASWWPAWLWEAMSERAGDHEVFTRAVERCRADLDPSCREALVPRMREGDLYAVVAHGLVARLDDDVVTALVSEVESKVRSTIERAGHGWDEPDIDPLAVLIELSMEYPRHERWEVICEAVARGAGSPGHLISDVERLANCTHRLTPDQRAQLNKALERLGHLPERSFGTAVNRTQLSAAVANAQAAMAPAILTPSKMVTLAQGEYSEQKAAILAVARTRDSDRLHSLVAFLASPDPRIRGLVAHCLMGWIGDAVAPQESLEVVMSLLQGSGAYLARSVGNLLEESSPSEQADTVAAYLKAHPSARARNAAQIYLASSRP